MASSALTYTTMSQIATFGHTWNGSSLLLTYTYNKDHQRSKLVANDNTYLPAGLAPASTSYTTNALNQYTAVGATTYSYDGRGNLTGNGVWTFGYDTENRLVSASKSGASISYAYDALGRRLSKTVNGVTTSWASYGNREIAEYQGTGTPVLQSRTVFGPGLDEPIASISPANVRTYLFQDALGSVIALANASGQVTEKYAYTAYGLNTVIGSGTSAYRYAGRRFEPETGLYYNRARAYSPALGRFLQTDPIGTEGGINLYAYCANAPLNCTDPLGLWSLDADLVLLGLSIGIGEKSGQAFWNFRAGLVGAGVSYNSSADIPIGPSGVYPGECSYCDVRSISWDTTVARLGAQIGPMNISLFNDQFSLNVSEYGKNGFLQAEKTQGNLGFSPEVSLTSGFGYRLTVGLYADFGGTVPWPEIQDILGWNGANGSASDLK